MRTSAGTTMGEGSTITKIAMIMGWYPDRDDDYTQRSTSSIYFDEFWLTDGESMPKLPDWQLLGKEAPSKVLIDWNKAADATKSTVKKINAQVEKTPLGDIAGLAELKAQLANK